jgi:hypothetical protein
MRDTGDAEFVFDFDTPRSQAGHAPRVKALGAAHVFQIRYLHLSF